jgi:hypothetical protein
MAIPTNFQAIEIVPCDASAPFWSQTTTLDGTPYLLTFRYNSREATYYLCIDSADGTVNYAQGVKLVSGIYLLRSTGDSPPGELIVIPAGTDDRSPTLGDFADGGRCQLFYVTEAALFALGGEASGEPQRFIGSLV